MGYDVHITRAEDWTESHDFPIPLHEWLAYVRDDGEMRLDRVAIATIKGEPVLAYENDGLAVWLAYSKHQESGNMAWFDHRDGCVVVKNPDDEILAKMKAIATKIKARVIGDEGEEY